MNTPSKSIPPVAGTYRTSRTDGVRPWREAMPIVDVSDQALDVLVDRWAGRGRIYYVWLRVLRPLGMLLLWGVLGLYVWRNLLNPRIVAAATPTLQYYALMVAAIIALMLLVVLVDRMLRQRKRQEQERTVTPQCVAQYARLEQDSVRAWQRQRCLMVFHDEQGKLRDACPATGAAA